MKNLYFRRRRGRRPCRGEARGERARRLGRRARRAPGGDPRQGHNADSRQGHDPRRAVRTSEPGLQDFVFVTLKANTARRIRRRRAAARRARTPAWCSRRTAFRGGTASAFRQQRHGHPICRSWTPNADLARAIPAQNIIGGVVYSANEVREPGVIVNNVPGNNMLVVGHADDRDSEAIRSLRQASRPKQICTRRRPRTSASRCGGSWCRT